MAHKLGIADLDSYKHFRTVLDISDTWVSVPSENQSFHIIQMDQMQDGEVSDASVQDCGDWTEAEDVNGQ